MSKPQRKPRRTVYDQNYYKAQAMLRNPWFIDKIAWLKNRFKEVGCPLPNKGFKKYAQYEAWRDKFWDTHSAMGQSAEYKARVREITGGKDRISLEEYNAVEAFKESYLPPVYGAVFGDIIEHFKINRDDRQFRQFVELYIFLGKTEHPTSLFSVRWIRNRKTDQMELFIQLFGHTKKEDIVNNWDFITRDQHHLPGYLGKSKEWKEFERDLEVYEAYKKLRKNVLRRPDREAADYKVISELGRKYPKLTTGQIRGIVTKTAKRLGETT
ncbi:hypothetical protein A2704_01160 [Candidatus Kaiserbacteria bacterium RIFCSPHIGHO2_01_FULL_54_36b]|uniref:Uncharacterized protein n=1 Tax=Candidatus Kaiserbacteria bacterium RIFCSPHIGHO2_01_FULL_54_36b TaxID=1798483 RepID=A0A1F6CJX4_9BACT|nr:MAG: hypothetical protein A2704_01160 [Candidatus Kaiserbacteria bacterium RIFCSPHIGHO2_01_FULL_54_36b]